MGRPLKITKAGGTVDTGYNNYPPGVTGGDTGQTGSQVKPRVKIGSASNADGYIIRQKGKKKFLVADATAIQEEDIVAGQSYVITDTSNTDWTYFGVKNAANGVVFTSTVAGTGITTNGVVNLVGSCTLVDKANGALAANEMNIVATFANAATTRIASISNKFVVDFSGNKYLAAYAANASTTPETVTITNA
jgi:hypothetical protein